jgi:hypothetical protein
MRATAAAYAASDAHCSCYSSSARTDASKQALIALAHESLLQLQQCSCMRAAYIIDQLCDSLERHECTAAVHPVIMMTIAVLLVL